MTLAVAMWSGAVVFIRVNDTGWFTTSTNLTSISCHCSRLPNMMSSVCTPSIILKVIPFILKVISFILKVILFILKVTPCEMNVLHLIWEVNAGNPPVIFNEILLRCVCLLANQNEALYFKRKYKFLYRTFQLCLSIYLT